MIEYVEIRDEKTNVIGILDITKSIIWHSVYYGVGDFEIYAPALPEIVALLRVGRYVTRIDNHETGIIESVSVTDNEQDGTTITATGRFVKSILARRIIYKLSGTSNAATILSGNVEQAVRAVVLANAIDCPFDSKRNFALLALGDIAGIPATIVDSEGDAAEKQVSYDNLLEYTDGVLEEYGLSATCILNNGAFWYTVYAGADRSANNTAGNIPIVFSREFDNLSESAYSYDTTGERNVALVGGEGEGIERFYTLIAKNESDMQRREMFIDASSINKKYKDESDVEQTYTAAQYKAMLDTKGKQDMATLVAAETFTGVIDVTNGNWLYGRDFALGDIVTVQDNKIGAFANVRIREAIEVQDENGYSVEVVYQ